MTQVSSVNLIHSIDVGNKIEGKIAYIKRADDVEEHKIDTSLDSVDTDQIFMTYAENDNKSTSDEYNHDFKNPQLNIDSEINRIKHNLQMPTIETEEDEEEKQGTFEYTDRGNKKYKWVRETNSPYNYEYKLDHNNQVKYLPEIRQKSVYNPLSRKMVLLEYDGQADIAEARHCNSTSGFILAPVLKFEKDASDDKYLAAGVVQPKDNKLILAKLMNSSILKSFTCTPIKILSCGFEHWAVLTSYGTVATWGYGASGCLGHGSYTSYTSPKLVQFAKEGEPKEYLSNIQSLECGGYHIWAIDSDYKVYAWGRGDVGQLGLYKDQLYQDRMGRVQLEPKVLEYFSDVPIAQVACGEAHTIVLDRWGRLFAFGWSQLGQLGVGKVGKGKEYEIHHIDSLEPIAKIYWGAIFSMAISISGKVYVWGSGENGQLGLGLDIKESVIPIQVGEGTSFWEEKVIDGQCGNSHAVVITETGNVYGWGQGIIDSDDHLHKSHSKNDNNESTIEIKSFDVHPLDSMDPCHKFLLKKKAPPVVKPRQYYSTRCSPERQVEMSIISSNYDQSKKNTLEPNTQRPSPLRNHLPSSKVPFTQKPFNKK